MMPLNAMPIQAQLISVTLADGQELDLMPNAITMFESMSEGKNPNFPDAKAFIHYSLGREDNTALLTTTFNDLIRMLNINVVPGDWLLVTRADGDRLAVLKQNVVSRVGVASGGSKITLVTTQNGDMAVFDLQESLDEVRGKMAQPAMSLDSPPEGLIPMDPPAPAKPRRAKK